MEKKCHKGNSIEKLSFCQKVYHHSVTCIHGHRLSNSLLLNNSLVGKIRYGLDLFLHEQKFALCVTFTLSAKHFQTQLCSCSYKEKGVTIKFKVHG